MGALTFTILYIMKRRDIFQETEGDEVKTINNLEVREVQEGMIEYLNNLTTSL
jgi:hypothetical protein